MSLTVRQDGSVAIVTLDRPARRNAFTMAMRSDIAVLFSDLAEDNDVRAVVLTGAGGHFCAGADTDEMGSSDVPAFLQRMRQLHRMIRAVTDLPKPVVAAVDGACVGAGWSLALACDMIVAAPDAGAIWQLARLVGPMRAKEIVYSGRIIDAREALQLGLILKIAPEAIAFQDALDLAHQFTHGPPVAHAMSKQLFDAAWLSFDQFLGQELAVQPMLSQTADHREGLAAAREKRPPHFAGR